MNFLNRVSKDNVAQLVVLELANPQLATRTNRDPINQVCIANTHLYSNKEFPDVKLWQAWQLLQELENFALSRGTSLPLMMWRFQLVTGFCGLRFAHATKCASGSSGCQCSDR